MDKTLHTILSELRREFETLYGDRLVKMILYGSQARGDAVEGSDIDVLVVLKEYERTWKEIERTSDIIYDFSLEHDIVIAPVFMDEERFTTRYGPLLRNVRREGIPI